MSIADRVRRWLVDQVARAYLWVHRRAPFLGITVYRVLLRILGASLLERVLDLPPLAVPRPAPGDVCLHVLTKHNEALFALWACRSLLERLDRSLPVFIHDDGSLTSHDIARIQASLPGALVVTRTEADRLARERLAHLPRCLELRAANVLSLKLFDPWVVQATGDVILIDSDVLFFRRPVEVQRWLDDPQGRFNRWNVETRIGKPADQEAASRTLNSGFGLITRASIAFDAIEAWLDGNQRLGGWLIEQEIYDWLSGGAEAAGLPLDYHVANAIDPRPPSSVSTHYVGSVRGFFLSEGIPRLVTLIPAPPENLRSSPP